MIAEYAGSKDERMQARLAAAVEELTETIRGRYPDATFELAPGHDPEGLYVWATVDVDDTDEVFDLIVGRLLEMQVDEGLDLYVLPVRPIERVYAELRAEAEARANTR